MASCKQLLILVSSVGTLYILYCRVIISMLKKDLEKVNQAFTMSKNTNRIAYDKLEVDRDVWKARYNRLCQKAGHLK